MRFANPAGAAALVAVAVLVALYLYDRRRRTIPVGTLFLWQKIASQTRDRQRFRPELLFVLQLALLLALIAGFMRPVSDHAAPPPVGRASILVLDVSASMQAREDDGTRFELARRRAADRVTAGSDGDETMVVTAGTRPAVTLRWTNDAARVRAALEALEPTDAPGDLAPAVELALGLARERPGARVSVFTDLPPEASGMAPDQRARLDYVQVGRTDDNVAVAGITVAAPPFHGVADTTATIDVRNYGRTSRDVVLEAAVDGAPWARRGLPVGPRATEHVLLTGPPASGVLQVRLAGDDALAVDDRAAAWIAPGTPLDLLLVTDSRELSTAFGEIAAAIAGSRVEITSRERYTAEPPAGRRVALFDGFVPATLPLALNALFVAPPAGNDVCPAGGRREHVTVVDWDADHPALAGLGPLQALAVDGASQLDEADWGTSIVLGASEHVAFPLLVAGERNGRRTACLGAELAGPLASADRVPLLLLTLASLRWLAEPFGPSALVVDTGRPVLVGPGPTTPVKGDGLEITGDPTVLVASRAGVFTIGPPGAERNVLANLFDDRESDIGRSGPGEWPATVVDAVAPTQHGGRRLDGWLYAIALVLVAVEWTAWQRTRR